MNTKFSLKYLVSGSNPTRYNGWVLAALLNHCKLPYERFHALSIGDAPAGVGYAVLMAAAACATNEREFKRIQYRARHHWHHLSWKERHQPSRLISRDLLGVIGVDTAKLRAAHTGACHDLIWMDKEGVAHSRQLAGFSYDSCDAYEAEIDRFVVVSCPECSNKHHVHVDECSYLDVERYQQDPLAFIEQYEAEMHGFDRISGPYFRCTQCDRAVRPDVDVATDLPSGWDYGETLHEDYVGDLDNCLSEMRNYLSGLGLPQPHGLRADLDNVDWRGRSAWTTFGVDPEEFASKISVNSDYSITNGRLMVEAGGEVVMRCGLSHHDASGSVATRPYWLCELQDELSRDERTLTQLEMTEEYAGGWAKVALSLLAGESRHQPLTEGCSMKWVHVDSVIEHFDDLLTWLERAIPEDETEEDGLLLATLTAGQAIAGLIAAQAATNSPPSPLILGLAESFGHCMKYVAATE